VTTERAITQIITKSLFGYLDYTLSVTANAGPSDGIILYGDNGSGKTTILELLFHLLSSAPNRGHRNAIAGVPFKMFQVVLTDGTSITAARAADRLSGAYALIAERSGDRIADCIFDPESLNKFSPPDTENEFLSFLDSLNLSVHYLSSERRMVTDVWQYSATESEVSAFAQVELLAEWSESKRGKLPDGVYKRRGRAFSPDAAIKLAEEWIRGQAVRATNVGSENTNSIYTDIIKRIAQPHDGSSGIDSRTSDTVRVLESLHERTKAFARYGFTPLFAADELLRSINQVSADQRHLLDRVLEPFVGSMTARLDALEGLQRLTSTFVGHLESFFRNKLVSFDLAQGFSIRSPTGQPLETAWLSSGEQHLLMLLCLTLIGRDKPSIFIVDEPELSLNVKWQRSLLNALLSIVDDASVQFVFATHSLEIISDHRDKVLALTNIERTNGERGGAKVAR
jgi:energy-coupling factor transporter ATP-binding protein EcfA2